MKLRRLLSTVESAIMSMCGCEKLFFKHALFRSMKSTHIRHLPLHFLTITTFDSHFGYYTSLMNPVINIQSISSTIAIYFCALKLYYLYLTILAFGSTHRQCSTIVLSMSSMSSWSQVNMSPFSSSSHVIAYRSP